MGEFSYKQDIQEMIVTVDKGRLLHNFLVYYKRDGDIFGFQVKNKQYDIMTVDTFKELVSCQLLLDNLGASGLRRFPRHNGD